MAAGRAGYLLSDHEATDRARMPDHPWVSYLEGKNPTYPCSGAAPALERIRNAHAALLSDKSTPDTRFADTVMDQNPANIARWSS
jgi:hypothetical protein